MQAAPANGAVSIIPVNRPTMKKIIHSAVILCFLFLQVQSLAHTVVIKGYIKDSANHALANKTVSIYNSDSTNTSCKTKHTVITNPNGYYIDTMSCSVDIKKLIIVVENCNGVKIIREVPVSGSNTVESNFILCNSTIATPVACRAAYSYVSIATGIKFNGAGSGVSAGDTIVSRYWSFGDSSEVLKGNEVAPLHNYRKPGRYTVCLTIKTKRGCESKYCSIVVYSPESNECKTDLKINYERIQPRKIRFNSGASVILLGDSIFQRIWKFGDGTSIDGNQVSPLKEYKDTGTYTVCLKVTTMKNCEKTYCITIVVRDSANTVPGCKAIFSYTSATASGTLAGIKFNSAQSTTAGGDSIISRKWFFGDSTEPMTGNRTDPTHVYAKAGSYNVCLIIKTKNGCESKYCATVSYKPAGECFVQVHAKTERISIKKFKFSSNTVSLHPGDTIKQRIWTFGDGTTLAGNEVYPLKEYKDTGVFKVCVKVKTAWGCEGSYCFTVTVRDTLSASGACKAYFTYAVRDSVIRFNSAGSHAGVGDSIISRTWYYMDSTLSSPLVLTGNVIDTFIKYTRPGKYTVYLSIKTKKGCESKYAGVVEIVERPNTCRVQAEVTFERISARKFRFNSAKTLAQGDSITYRKWKFGDGTVLEGNEISPWKEYKDTGKYNVCIYLKTKNGCEKEYCFLLVIRDSITSPAPCKALFSFAVQNNVVKFNSSASKASDADSIIGRTWLFGDSTQPVTNIIEPYHVYAKPGKYQVYLYIKTKNGCESKFTATIETGGTPNSNCHVEALFVATRMAGKKVQFNSSASKAQAGDSIIQRRWKFGDGTALNGNEVNPVKEFPLIGIYNTCLQVKTAKGCETQVCKQVTVQDSVNLPEANVDFVKIMSINPNPVVTRMLATIWSRNRDAEVEITIYDIYGTRKLSFKKVLTQGNNIIEIAAGGLYHGPYFLKVSSRFGRDSKAFYKL